MVKKIFILGLYLFFLFEASQAKEVTQNMANTIALNFILATFPELNITRTEQIIELGEEGLPQIYVVNFTEGFVLVSAETCVYPILGYSLENSFDGGAIPSSFDFLLNSWKEQIAKVQDSGVKPNAEIAKIWQGLLVGSLSLSSPKQLVEPLTDTYWNQGCYFNSALPVDSSGSCYHPYTGCVATGLAQILKYYNYPKNGKSSHGIYTPYGWLEVNFDATEYSWADMVNSITGENPAIAELMLHCVVGVNSQFIPGGTGAYDIDARNALVDYFRYDENASFHWRDSYSGDWPELIRDELLADRPVLYGGVEQETGYGHTFVCDGFDESNFFHINWGWGGMYNGYFYLDSLIGGNYHFNYLHDAIIGIRPDISATNLLYPAENLIAEVNQRDVILNWQEPSVSSSLELLGYNIYRNDTLLNNSIVTNPEYTDLNAPAGNQQYKVKTTFIGSGNGPEITTEVYVSGILSSLLNSVNIYPNPASSVLYVDLKQNQHTALEFNLFDGMGRKFSLDRIKKSGSLYMFNCEKFGKGVYVLNIELNGESYFQKVLIK